MNGIPDDAVLNGNCLFIELKCPAIFSMGAAA